MRLSPKVLIVAMIVLMLCCVSAASATDVDDLVVTEDTDILEVDDTVDSVDIVEQDESTDIKTDSVDKIEEDCSNDFIEDIDNNEIINTNENIVVDDNTHGNLRNSSYIVVTSNQLYKYFNPNGYLKTTSNLEFQGNFKCVDFGFMRLDHLIIQNNIKIKFTNAVFNNLGLRLYSPGLSIDGGLTFINNESAYLTESLYIGANNITINNVNFNVTAPLNKTCYAINVLNSNNTQLLNNTFYYLCNYSNPDYYNYVIKVKNSADVKVEGNNITACLPLKTVKHYTPGLEGLDKDFVAGVAVTNSSFFNLTNNTIDITSSNRDGGYPTLDGVLLWYSDNSTIARNKITVKDTVTSSNQYSYIYGVDVFKSNNVTVDNNTITMNADNSGGYVGGNGTGAAYCVQFTGGYTGAVVSNNVLTTQNHGPNAAIYSQNYDGRTNITITGNTISVTGKGTASTWDLLTGIELQDDYATVSGNTITVNNLGAYNTGYNVYGISYCQSSPRNHTYSITGNTVTVNEGFYTIYIMNGYGCNVTGNTLNSEYGYTPYSGNQTVYVGGSNNYIGPNP